MSVSDEKAIKRIKGFISSGKIPHALCFTASSGIADELAFYTARVFLCGKGDFPCEICSACKKVQSRSHPDLINVREFTDAENPGKVSSYRVAELREIVADSITRPNDGDLKVYIFKDADTMSAACQNALLKFTEEPPDYVRIIFTAHSRDSFLDTIKSRLVFIDAMDDGDEPLSAEAEELQNTAREFIHALSESSEYRAAAVLSKIKTRDELSRISEYISEELRKAMLSSVFPLKNAAKAQKFLLDFTENLRFNPNITLACTYITAGICEELKI
ncbi:MAG: hypothetical protein FWG70_08795 [Oscillospiraceae bacterium]|nr:hypothetical protein [Oscillospiraceae bacterium]